MWTFCGKTMSWNLILHPFFLADGEIKVLSYLLVGPMSELLFIIELLGTGPSLTASFCILVTGELVECLDTAEEGLDTLDIPDAALGIPESGLDTAENGLDTPIEDLDTPVEGLSPPKPELNIEVKAQI